ncbi:MAG: hypothetical protein Q9M50_05250 [Methylococcales bacterium]|nr:hypothetical protein [Methylococcales bacterium]
MILTSFMVGAMLTACSDDEAKSVREVDSVFNHPHEKVTDIEKHKFEHEFSQDCVVRELKNSTNRVADKKRFSKACMCIAKFMMKDLTAVEAEKFLKEDKDTQSLRIRFDNAAYNCLQEDAKTPGPKLFGKPKAS